MAAAITLLPFSLSPRQQLTIVHLDPQPLSPPRPQPHPQWLLQIFHPIYSPISSHLVVVPLHPTPTPLCCAPPPKRLLISILVNARKLSLSPFVFICIHVSLFTKGSMECYATFLLTMLDIENNTGQKAWQAAEFVFGWIYVLEMALKVYSFGFQNYWRDGQNRFDFLVTWIIVIGETITFVTPDGLIFFSNGEWIRYLLIARMLRLIRILMHVQRYRAFVATFLALIPSLMPYLGTIFCILCIYCTLGVQVFGGIVNAGNASLEGTDLYEDDYLLFNFNDYPNGMVTLFNLLVMGNWQIWMEIYKELTGTWWSVAYFVSFYLITVLLLLNLVVAFVLEAFFAEMDLETSEKCEGDEKEVDGAKDRRRSLGSKTRNQRIDVLLHHMLSAELTETQPSNA